MDKTAHVQGYGLYLEYEKPSAYGMAVQQVLVAPDGLLPDGTVVTMRIFRRRMNPGEGKKQWSNTKAYDGLRVDALTGDVAPIADDEWEKRATLRLDYAQSLFDSIASQGWALRNRPLSFEVSQIDLQDIQDSKTPYKLMYRMQQCRLKAGFPVDPVAEKASA
jgi:hypothetical protein